MKKILLLLAGAFLPLLSFAQEEAAKGWDERINEAFEPIATWWINIVLTSIPLGEGINLPIVLVILIGGALFFTIAFKFVNFRHFGTAIKVVRGKYDSLEGRGPSTTDTVNVVEGDVVHTIKDEGHTGEVSHFQALTSAVSGTVGLGNIAGVAVAIVTGGPGATLWMIVAGLLGMSSKFVECTLGVKYRDIDETGKVYGGPMYYMTKGLRERGMANFGKILAVIYAVLVIGASFGGGNMFQSNQAAAQIITQFNWDSGYSGTLLGVIMAFFVGLVIVGGIKRIGSTTEKIVPFMAGLYILAGIAIIIMNIGDLGPAFGLIFTEAFNAQAVGGGVLGALIVGFQRAAFSNEAGVGSAAIAHSAVKTKFAASEGIVALLEPFIDTVVICTMTALVIIITGNHLNPEGLNGVDLTTKAFSTIPNAPYVLTLAIVLFAFSTMITWSYYGTQAWLYLFGKSKSTEMAYKVLFLFFVVIGAASQLDAVINFSDAMILALVFPNMIGLLFLFPNVRGEFVKYLDAIKNIGK